MSGKTIKPTSYAEQKYNATALLDFDTANEYSSVLLAVAGADGELADAELQWYINELTLLGYGQDYLDAIRRIDWKNVSIEEALSSIQYNLPLNLHRSLLYQAVKMSRADGVYHEKEKAAVAKIAEILGIDRSILATIESIAEMEESTELIAETEESTSQLLRSILSGDT